MWSDAARKASAESRAASAKTKAAIETQANKGRPKPSAFQQLKAATGSQTIVDNKVVPVATQFGQRNPQFAKDYAEKQAHEDAVSAARAKLPANANMLKDIHDRLKSALNDRNQNPQKAMAHAVKALAPTANALNNIPSAPKVSAPLNRRATDSGGVIPLGGPTTRAEQEDHEASQYLSQGSNKSGSVPIHNGSFGRRGNRINTGGKAFGDY